MNNGLAPYFVRAQRPRDATDRFVARPRPVRVAWPHVVHPRRWAAWPFALRQRLT
jgi:hypothetical protein